MLIAEGKLTSLLANKLIEMHDKYQSIINVGKNIFLLLFLITFIIGCSQEGSIPHINAVYESLEELKPMDSVIFYLDHETTPDLRNIEITNENDTSYLYFQVLHENLIKKYSFYAPDLISTIDLRGDGPSTINRISVCQHVSPDTLLCVNYVGALALIPLKEHDGSVIKINTLALHHQSRILFDPTLMPVIKENNETYILPNNFTFDYDQNMFAKVNFKDKSLTMHLLPPENYIKGYFAYKRFAYLNYAYNEKEELIYLNFTNLDSIHIYNLDFRLEGKKGLSSILKNKSNDPLFAEENPTIAAKNGIRGQVLENRAKQQFIYESLLHNKQKDTYYRFVGLPISQNLIDLQDSIKSEIRKYSLIIANAALDRTKEYAIPFNKYALELKAYFIHEGKLYIQRNIDSEDEIIVDIFDI